MAKLLLSGLASLIVSIADRGPIDVAHAFCRVNFHLLAQSYYFQLKFRLHLETEEYIYSEQLLEYMCMISFETFRLESRQFVKIPRNFQILAYVTVSLFHLDSLFHLELNT